jgi:4'-phosphopantetheinyl transferase
VPTRHLYTRNTRIFCFRLAHFQQHLSTPIQHTSVLALLARILAWSHVKFRRLFSLFPAIMLIDTRRAAMANGLPTPPDSAGSSSCGEPTVTTWLIDTRTIWAGDNIWSAHGAAKAMALVSTAEQNIIASKMFIADARMSLASALLKRLFISKTLGIPWKNVNIARKGDAKHGKPCAVDDFNIPIEGIDFNISHQNGLVALIGYDGITHGASRSYSNPLGYPSPSAVASNAVTVGIDIVCVNERDDHRTIEEEGLDGWVDIYDIIFSDEERWSMKYDVDYVTMLDGTHLDAHDLGRNDRCIARNQNLLFRTPSGNLLYLLLLQGGIHQAFRRSFVGTLD